MAQPLCEGSGPTGRAWKLSCAQWTGDLQHELELPFRGRVHQAGLRACVALPIFAEHGEVVSVLELWSPTSRLVDRDLLALAASICKQLLRRCDSSSAAPLLRAS
jgi:hypothetical protein